MSTGAKFTAWFFLAIALFGVGALCGYDGGMNKAGAQLDADRATLADQSRLIHEAEAAIKTDRELLKADEKLMRYCREDLQRIARSACRPDEILTITNDKDPR